MARRGRKRHVQLELLNKRGTGKARVSLSPRKRGPGRPRKQGRRMTEHLTRPAVKAYEPQHVVLRVVGDIGSLRRRDCYRALRKATLAVAGRGEAGRGEAGRGEAGRGEAGRGEAGRGEAGRGDIRRAGAVVGAFRIVHVSIQGDHVHLLVEADDRVALSRGMQAFMISAAKHLNAVVEGEVRRRGRVFADRYHANAITNRKQARHALSYVLNNWRKHREDRGVSWRVDPFSTGHAFDGWRRGERGDDGRVECGWERPEEDRQLEVWAARSWLLRVGWSLYGAISVDEVPSTPVWAMRAR